MAWGFARVLMLSDVPVKKYYKYKDMFQILPVEPEAPKPPYVISHHPLIIEYKYFIDETPRCSHTGNKLPQWIVNNEEVAKGIQEIILLLTAFSQDNIFSYSNKQSWFIPMDNENESKKIQWGQEGYSYDGFKGKINSFTKPQTKPVKLVDPNVFFNRYGRLIDKEFDLPKNIDVLLEKYFSLDKETQKSFLSACSLLSQGMKLWSEHPSLSFAALVSSLETLIALDHKNTKVEKCKVCDQERYRVVQKFKNFFGKYGSPTPEFQKYAVKIYKYRSKILHRGELFFGELSPRGFGSIEGYEDDELRRNVVRTCRICFVNWLSLKNSTAISMTS